MTTEVIIAGGGPVGLTLAALLDAAGVAVTVFERDTEPSVHSRATTMHPRTLETLEALRLHDQRRVSDVLVERGRRVPSAHFAALPTQLDYTRLPTRYPFVLLIPQARTEAVLAEYLRGHGVPVHRGREVTGYEQDADGVRVRVGNDVVAAGYLIGADGAHSLVRKLSGVGFTGVPPTVVGFGGDVRLAEQPTTAAYHWRRDVGSVAVVPLSDTEVRVFGAQAGDTGLTPAQARVRQAQPLTLAELRDIMTRVIGEDIGLRGASWLTRTSNTTRHADHYRVGRVMLAGDAAHVHLPAGGQGLNVGVQDAANLAWKLAAEIQGWAPAAVLAGPASYDEERRVVGERLAGNTMAQDALMHTFTAAGESLREMFAGLLTQESVADELRGWLSGLALTYPQPPGAAPLVGGRAPDLSLPDGALLRRLRPDRLLLLDFTDKDTFAELATPRLEVLAADPAGSAWQGSTAALVRPDGYVAHTSTATTSAELAGELDAWTPATVAR